MKKLRLLLFYFLVFNVSRVYSQIPPKYHELPLNKSSLVSKASTEFDSYDVWSRESKSAFNKRVVDGYLLINNYSDYQYGFLENLDFNTHGNYIIETRIRITSTDGYAGLALHAQKKGMYKSPFYAFGFNTKGEVWVYRKKYGDETGYSYAIEGKHIAKNGLKPRERKLTVVKIYGNLFFYLDEAFIARMRTKDILGSLSYGNAFGLITNKNTNIKVDYYRVYNISEPNPKVNLNNGEDISNGLPVKLYIYAPASHENAKTKIKVKGASIVSEAAHNIYSAYKGVEYTLQLDKKLTSSVLPITIDYKSKQYSKEIESSCIIGNHNSKLPNKYFSALYHSFILDKLEKNEQFVKEKAAFEAAIDKFSLQIGGQEAIFELTCSYAENLVKRGEVDRALVVLEKLYDFFDTEISERNLTELESLTRQIYQQTFDRLKENLTIEACDTFIEKYPKSGMVDQVILLKYGVAFENAKSVNTTEGYSEFINLYPLAPQVSEASEIKQQLAFNNLVKSSNLTDYIEFFFYEKEHPLLLNFEDNFDQLEVDNERVIFALSIQPLLRLNHLIRSQQVNLDEAEKRMEKCLSNHLSKYISTFPKGLYIREALEIDSIWMLRITRPLPSLVQRVKGFSPSSPEAAKAWETVEPLITNFLDLNMYYRYAHYSDAPEVIKKYLEVFPSGLYADNVNSRLAAIQFKKEEKEEKERAKELVKLISEPEKTERPKSEKAEAYLMRLVHSDSRGVLSMVKFEKENGMHRNFDGYIGYQIDFKVEAKVLTDQYIWGVYGGSLFRMDIDQTMKAMLEGDESEGERLGKGYGLGGYAVLMNSAAGLAQARDQGGRVDRIGSIQAIRGRLLYISTEKGWIIKGCELQGTRQNIESIIRANNR